MSKVTPTTLRMLGRYALFDEIAGGGMATVHLGRMIGPAGFAKTVAIKRLHAEYARDPAFVGMFLDEAMLAARIHHPNVVSTLDVVAEGGELFLVMEYVPGESFAKLLSSDTQLPATLKLPIIVRVMVDVLHGLHAAHEARDEQGKPLNIVHRDVSPQNILVGCDGAARVLDFGIAKAANRSQTTKDGQLKGKLRYMAPEQVRLGPVDRRVDVYAAAVVLWEAIAGRQLWDGDPAAIVHSILEGPVEHPCRLLQEEGGSEALDEIVLRGLSRDVSTRYSTALEFACALEQSVRPARLMDVGEWVNRLAAASLQDRASLMLRVESARTPTREASPRRVHADDATDITAVRVPNPPLPSIATPSAADAIEANSTRANTRPRSAWGVWLAIAVVAIVSAIWLALRDRSLPPAVSPSATAVRVEPSVVASESPLPSSAVSAASSTPTVTTPKLPASVPRSRSGNGKRQGPSCNPPYMIEPDGTKRYKVECL